jgi:RimJ/RimL family protein N-acetyltransferase
LSETLAALPRLRTARLRLAPLGLSDAAQFRAVTDDPKIIAGVDFLSHPFTLADARALIRGAGDGRDRFIGISRNARLIGVVGAHLKAHERIEIGYWIGSAWSGRGYATEAAAAVIASLRRRFPQRRIFAECRPGNRASWRVLEKLGFSPTGKPGARPGRADLVLRGASEGPG